MSADAISAVTPTDAPKPVSATGAGSLANASKTAAAGGFALLLDMVDAAQPQTAPAAQTAGTPATPVKGTEKDAKADGDLETNGSPKADGTPDPTLVQAQAQTPGADAGAVTAATMSLVASLMTAPTITASPAAAPANSSAASGVATPIVPQNPQSSTAAVQPGAPGLASAGLALADITAGQMTAAAAATTAAPGSAAVQASSDRPSRVQDPQLAAVTSPPAAAPASASASGALASAPADATAGSPSTAAQLAPADQLRASGGAPTDDAQTAAPAQAAVAQAAAPARGDASVGWTRAQPGADPTSNAAARPTSVKPSGSPKLASVSAGQTVVSFASTSAPAVAPSTDEGIQADADTDQGFGAAPTAGDDTAPQATAVADGSEPQTSFSAALNGAEPAVQASAPDAAPQASPATVQHLAGQIARGVQGQSSRFEVQLDPAGLGGVRVSVEIDAKGRLSATMAFDRPESAAALQGRAQELQSALEKAGFDLSGAGLNFSTGGGGDFAGQGGGQAFGQSGALRGERLARAFDAASETADSADASASIAYQQRRSVRAVDIRI